MKTKFAGSVEQDSQKTSVPMSLLSLVGMVLEGRDIISQSEVMSQAVLNIAQLVQFNSYIHRRDEESKAHSGMEYSLTSVRGSLVDTLS